MSLGSGRRMGAVLRCQRFGGPEFPLHLVANAI